MRGDIFSLGSQTRDVYMEHLRTREFKIGGQYYARIKHLGLTLDLLGLTS
jgi:hypothetical protein